MATSKARACELCSSDARMLCESDQARLCWDCDEKVHAANFLVAKHTRTALCHVCHSPTPWKASGPSLGRTVSVCAVCVSRSARARAGSGGDPAAGVRIAGDGGVRQEEVDEESGSESGDDDEISDSDSVGGESDCSDDDDDEDDDENQVVPWTSTSTSPPPPPASGTSTSCSEEEDSLAFGSGESVSTSRFRDLRFELNNSNSEIGARGSNLSAMAARSRVMAEEDEEIPRPWKQRRVKQQPE